MRTVNCVTKLNIKFLYKPAGRHKKKKNMKKETAIQIVERLAKKIVPNARIENKGLYVKIINPVDFTEDEQMELESICANEVLGTAEVMEEDMSSENVFAIGYGLSDLDQY